VKGKFESLQGEFHSYKSNWFHNVDPSRILGPQNKWTDSKATSCY